MRYLATLILLTLVSTLLNWPLWTTLLLLGLTAAAFMTCLVAGVFQFLANDEDSATADQEITATLNAYIPNFVAMVLSAVFYTCLDAIAWGCRRIGDLYYSQGKVAAGNICYTKAATLNEFGWGP